jgi:hypothetical protein
MTQVEVFKCPYCGNNVVTHWIKGGGMLPEPDVVLIGDAVWHADCWDLIDALEEARAAGERQYEENVHQIMRVAALELVNAELVAALCLARPYIVQATEGMDPPAPALTMLDAALLKANEANRSRRPPPNAEKN